MKILKQQDIKKYREKLLKEQKGIDPLTNQVIQSPTLDHSHLSGNTRQVLDRNSNQFEGKIMSAFNRFLKHQGVQLQQVLLNLVEYLNKDYSKNPIHPKSISLLIKRFSRLNIKQQKQTLIKFKLTPGVSKKENTKVYRQYLLQKDNIYKV